MFKLTIGSSPWGEDCAQTANPDYTILARKECEVYAAQLARFYEAAHGKPLPTGLRLETTDNPHDFGIYHEVAAVAADDDSEAIEAAEWLESYGPEEWDEPARAALGIESV
jgi:hypothetical protein